MKKASITEAKNNLSALIDSVKGGSSVLIVDRGRPVARLEPIVGLHPDDDGRLGRLVREGIVRPARRCNGENAVHDQAAPGETGGLRRASAPRRPPRQSMKFWDASAIVPLLMTEPTTRAMQALALKDPAMLVWWATEVECASAVARLEREGALDATAVTQAFERLREPRVDGMRSIRAMPSGKRPCGSSAYIRCARLTRCSLRPHSSPRSAVPRLWMSSHWTTVWLRLPAKRDSC